jgi:1-acyl-sn-glycerol-3-phosphate acyltransferase
LLLREELVAVFPEGSKATDRPYEERYRLQRFGRGGYVKLALRTGTPVIPVAIVATEHESAVWRNRLANASRVLAAPFAALRPGLPRMGRLGMPPISARIRIYVGAPIAEISRHDAAVTQDDGLVHELNECVRSAVQSLVNASLYA